MTVRVSYCRETRDVRWPVRHRIFAPPSQAQSEAEAKAQVPAWKGHFELLCSVRGGCRAEKKDMLYLRELTLGGCVNVKYGDVGRNQPSAANGCSKHWSMDSALHRTAKIQNLAAYVSQSFSGAHQQKSRRFFECLCRVIKVDRRVERVRGGGAGERYYEWQSMAPAHFLTGPANEICGRSGCFPRFARGSM
eukprot:4067538-Prymnesium_polylepis.3